MTDYLNNDGLIEAFGIPSDFSNGALKTQGARKEVVFKLNGVTALPVATGTAKQDNASYIPANAIIESSKLIVTEAFVGGTSVGIGYDVKAGTAIDVDGVDVAIATAAIDAIGDVIVCNGALATDISIGAADAYLTTALVGTFTAGKADLIVTYIDVN